MGKRGCGCHCPRLLAAVAPAVRRLARDVTTSASSESDSEKRPETMSVAIDEVSSSRRYRGVVLGTGLSWVSSRTIKAPSDVSGMSRGLRSEVVVVVVAADGGGGSVATVGDGVWE